MAGLLLTACGADPAGVHPGAGARLPEVVLTGLGGEAPTSTTAFRGSPLVINFWATWCGPCRAEMPSLERLSQRLAAEGVRMIGVTADADLNLAREFVRTTGITFLNFIDGNTGSMRALLRVNALPETVLVASDGTIKARIAGGREWDGAEGIHLLREALGVRMESGSRAVVDAGERRNAVPRVDQQVR